MSKPTLCIRPIRTHKPRVAITPCPPPAVLFTVLTFVTAILWLNATAGQLVNISLIAGRILGIHPSLLGATVLAWGNSLPDLINNMSLARDGFPTMALAACLASPLFQMLAGMALGLSVGAIEEGGVLEFEMDTPLQVRGWVIKCRGSVRWWQCGARRV